MSERRGLGFRLIAKSLSDQGCRITVAEFICRDCPEIQVFRVPMGKMLMSIINLYFLFSKFSPGTRRWIASPNNVIDLSNVRSPMNLRSVGIKPTFVICL